MKSEWKIISLSDLSVKTEYGYTASAKDTNENNEPRFLRITDIQGGIVNWNTVPYCEIESSKLDKYKLNYGDIVVARTGNSTGENFMFDSEERVVYASYLIRYIINQNIAEPKFIWYQMRSSKWINFINNVKGGSAQAGANAKTMGAFECFVPPLPTQKKIAHILSTLDDKIELNRKMNQTLEEMAQALFKSWFVDFDPVHAKANCSSDEELETAACKLGILKEILDLFPSEFEESELGMIPNGWEVSKLGNILSVLESGSRPKGGINPTLKDGFASIGAESIDGIGNFNFQNTKYITNDFFNSLKRGIVSDYDVLVYKDGAYIGKKAMFGNGFPFQKFAINEHVFILRSNDLANQFFVYFLLEQDKLALLNTNSAQPGLNQESMKSYQIMLPNIKISRAFGKIVKILVDKILVNSMEIKTLQKTRDALLPKLLSGELDVSELELDMKGN